MNAKPRSLPVLLTVLVIMLSLGGCWPGGGESGSVTECKSLKPGDSNTWSAPLWSAVWEERYADYRGRYTCKVKHFSPDDEWTGYYFYQFSCIGGRCLCEAGISTDSSPKSAEYTATPEQALSGASKACGFPDNLVEEAPWKPASGIVYTLAGNGQKGQQDGALHRSTLESPLAVAGQRSDSIYIATSASHRLRRITKGKLETLGKNLPRGHADGPVDTAGFQGVRAMLSDRAGSVYLADDLRIRVIKAGVMTTLAGDGSRGCADGSALAATFTKPVGLALAGTALYIADEGCNSLRLLKNGVVSTVAGNPKGKVHTGPVADVRFIAVKDVAVDAKGRVYVLGKNNVKVLEGGVISDLPLAAPDQLHEVRRLLTDQKSELVALTGSGLWKLEGGKLGPSTKLRVLLDPRGAQIDATGQLLIADRGAHKVFIYLP